MDKTLGCCLVFFVVLIIQYAGFKYIYPQSPIEPMYALFGFVSFTATVIYFKLQSKK
ncbi:hypothetical protein [Vibrio sp. 10N.261.51.F12]|uniref:hypothetical protein n=1 Tax=Vibrio sp. 10N.261.51.F12 TaxID=3229679 RepID=UPI00354E73D4